MFALGIAIVSCSINELETDNKYNIKEGVPTVTNLEICLNENRIITRTGASETVEKTVNDIFVIAFNSAGKISSYREEEDQKVVSGGIYREINNSEGSGIITGFTMYSGQEQTIYAIANVESVYTDLSRGALLEFDGDETEFLNLTCKLRDATNVDRGIFVMSGKISDFAIDENGTILSEETTIPLSRLEARVTFKIKTDNSKHSNLSFTPLYYRVHNISLGSYLLSKNKNDVGGDALWDYTVAGYGPMSGEKKFDNTDDSGLSGFFEFYVWENRLTPRKEITASDLEAGNSDLSRLYALREKRDHRDPVKDSSKPGQEYEPGEFTYANGNSTYVEIVGNLYYKDPDEEVSASVTYYVHLGDTRDDVNNYDTERNTHYIYTVTLSGVESLRVEVENDEEIRPGMEGDVTSTQRTMTFDSHYGRTSFTLNRGDFQRSENEGGGLSWNISTPFQNGTKTFNVDNYKLDGKFVSEEALMRNADAKEKLTTDLSLNDYRWIQFVINSEAIKSNGNKVSNDEFAKYPGYKAYYGEDLDSPASPFGSEGWHYSGETAYYGSNVPMYDINQLLNHLYVEANTGPENGAEGCIFDSDGNVTITAFIDEFIYIYDPTETYYMCPVATSKENLTLWKKTVNGRNRTMSISYGIGRQYSPDGNSSWQTARITFSQIPIYTFYNPEKVSTAWGTESIIESKAAGQGELRTYPSPQALSEESSSTDNGRENTIKIIPEHKNLRWSKIMNMETSSWGELRSGYQTIWYASLGRNRDLNGDDIVDKDEIRWYLASIDQLTDLWIGEDALPDAAKLYDVSEVTNGSVPKRHVASSSLFNNDGVNNSQGGNVWMIWAEEGASRGDVNRSWGSNETKYKYDYRCVRNLGIGLADIDDIPEDYVKLDTGTYREYQEYRIDVSRLNENTLRPASPNMVLGSHTERSNTNRPSKIFAVLRADPVYIGDSWDDVISERIGDPCPPGYRLPNQRELLLLTMYFGPDRTDTGYEDLFKYGENGERRYYVSRTEYGYSNIYSNYSNRPGFSFERVWDGSDVYAFNLLNQRDNNNYYVRCVRDVE